MSENVKELIEEVKNLSELMLDLAYSCVFFESKDIAKEVILSYDRLEELEEKLYLHLFAASRGRGKKLISVIDIVESAKSVASAAKKLSELVLEKKELHPIIKQALKESDETIARVVVAGSSILLNKQLGELKLRTEIGIDIVAIKRTDGQWIFDPKKRTMIKKNDVLIGVGPGAACDKLIKLGNGKLRRI